MSHSFYRSFADSSYVCVSLVSLESNVYLRDRVYMWCVCVYRADVGKEDARPLYCRAFIQEFRCARAIVCVLLNNFEENTARTQCVTRFSTISI